MTLDTRSRRSYVYRIPLDDSAAMIRLRRFKRRTGEYNIHQLKDSEVPNVNAKKNWGVVFYQSKETRGDQLGDFEGGTIPGLEEYRHSLDWKPTPETELLEMKRASDGGTLIRGEQFKGTHDPRLPDYAPVKTTVPWTPGEVKAMFAGEDVPNRIDYHHTPPMMDSSDAREEYRALIEQAAKDGLDRCEKRLHEMEDECDHDHAIEVTRGGFCEDCGRGWEDKREMEADGATIVGTA